MSYTMNFSLSLGAGKAGLADLRAHLVDSSGVNSGSALTTGFSEIGQGFYLWTYSSFADNFRGGVKFYSAAAASTVLGFSAINPEEAEYTNAKTSTRAIAGDAMTLATGAITAAVIATDAIDADAIAANAVTELQSGLSTLTTTDIDNRLTAYDAATGTEAASILAAIAALNNLSSAGAQAAAAAALSAYDAATATDITTAINAAASDITVISAVNGAEITVYQLDTWRFTVTLTGVNLSTYEAVGFVVKIGETQADNDAILLVRSDDGLVRINGAAATSSNGSLTVNSATSFTVVVDATVTSRSAARLLWWLKGFDATPTPDEAVTLAKGDFAIKGAGLRATE